MHVNKGEYGFAGEYAEFYLRKGTCFRHLVNFKVKF